MALSWGGAAPCLVRSLLQHIGSCAACVYCRRYLLTKLHPLLGGAVGLRGSTVVEARVLPHDGLWPTNQVCGEGRSAGGLPLAAMLPLACSAA